jgi:hypothetical protein
MPYRLGSSSNRKPSDFTFSLFWPYLPLTLHFQRKDAHLAFNNTAVP